MKAASFGIEVPSNSFATGGGSFPVGTTNNKTAYNRFFDFLPVYDGIGHSFYSRISGSNLSGSDACHYPNRGNGHDRCSVANASNPDLADLPGVVPSRRR